MLDNFSLFHRQIHQIDFDDENNVINKNVLLHKEGEIWSLSAAPFDRSLLASIYNKSRYIVLAALNDELT